MVALSLIESGNLELLSSTPLVAVIFGGTSGISEYTIRALAHTHSHAQSPHSLRVYIVGRNASAAQVTIAACKTLCPAENCEFIFVPAKDLSLLKDVERVCAEITQLEQEKEKKGGGKARVDFLMMSQTITQLSFLPRKDTIEGIDTQFSLHYYSRMFITQQLLPLLLASNAPSGATILSVYAAGMETTFFPSDLSLRHNYSFGNLRSQVDFMKTLYLERLTQQHPGKISAIHCFPGLVLGPAFWQDGYPWWFNVARWLMQKPVEWWVTLSKEETGQRMMGYMAGRYPARGGEGGKGGEVKTASDGEKGGGAYAVGAKGEVVDSKKAYGKMGIGREEARELVWEHTTKVFEVIKGGGVFKD